ncbi:MAG: tripartite tricarboxylate transporter substrate binding protein [Pseudomonadota bacterium]
MTGNFDLRRRDFAALALATLCGSHAVPSIAQTSYPTRPIKLIIPYAAGGGTDTVGRALADVMSRSLGQPVIVENRGGASAIVGTNVAAKAEADGYTILYGTDANLVLNPLLYKKLVYDPDRDFVPIGLVAEVPQLLAISPSIPPRNVKDFIAYARANPGTLNYSSPGRGGNGDLAAEMFMQEFKVDMQSISFSGGGPALAAVLAGTVQVYFGTTAVALPHIKAGKLVPLAVLTSQRQAALPEISTVAESGAPGFEATLRVGLVALAKTPPAIVERLNRAVNEALNTPAFRTQLEREGFIVARPGTPASYAALNQKAKETWGRIIRAKNISLD